EGVEYAALDARPLGLRPLTLLSFVRSWGRSIRKARRLFRQLRDEARGSPVRVIALGGFVAGPCVQAARVEGLDITLVNLDAQPGKANRWIARRADRCFTALPTSAVYARSWMLVPPIVRAAALGKDRDACRALIEAKEGERVLMITGGSLGASSINQAMIEMLPELAGELQRGRWRVLHQCGGGGGADGVVQQLISAYERHQVPATVVPLVKGLGQWWGAADFAISRAGAGSVGEAWANQTPTLFLPYPYHRDEHQRLNAERLVVHGGALVERDQIEARVNALTLGPLLVGILRDHERRAQMRRALAALGPADGAAAIARAVLAV
ncbi:MAG: UDP-N-acetylglucosamine--N-acetylmuramyl-(pentapeptide) pyrophosphoryl-undecaprenol N-acetylglucosamine transferase, partial [Phycisphaerales bacterium]|nr:UDP-N-acetylglucosamine--N-acetylmuramyl-(pentapeptide) pyrophosphoryl-undecaprenol N-acetylglucosamine transferase [Phycisphaerales bacterium]